MLQRTFTNRINPAGRRHICLGDTHSERRVEDQTFSCFVVVLVCLLRKKRDKGERGPKVTGQ